jgi:hypothetical protein
LLRQAGFVDSRIPLLQLWGVCQTEPDNIIHHLQGGEDLFDSDEVKKRLFNVVKVIKEDPKYIL